MLFPAGTLVMTHFIGANNDPGIWDNPHRFDPARHAAGSGHVTFGTGTHFCLGAALARAELGEAVRRLLVRLPEVALTEAPRFRPNDGLGMLVPERVAVSFEPTA